MADAPPPHGSRGWPPEPSAGADLWGPATAVRAGGSATAPSPSRQDPGRDAPANRKPAPPLRYQSPIPDTRRRGRGAGGTEPPDPWSEPRDGRGGRRRGDGDGRDPGFADLRPGDLRPGDARRADPRVAGPQHPDLAGQPVEAEQRGLPGWAGLLLLLVIAGIGGLIDTVSGAQVRGGFNIGIIVASIVAILAVKRSAMFPVVVAPPLVYAGASGAMLYLRSGGLNDRKVLFDAAANWLVYGFPAIAAATAAVLIIAGIRMVVRR